MSRMRVPEKQLRLAQEVAQALGKSVEDVLEQMLALGGAAMTGIIVEGRSTQVSNSTLETVRGLVEQAMVTDKWPMREVDRWISGEHFVVLITAPDGMAHSLLKIRSRETPCSKN